MTAKLDPAGAFSPLRALQSLLGFNGGPWRW
jgi:hypothetical protein